MKQDVQKKKWSFLDDKSKYAYSKDLDGSYERDINSPFMQRKMDQARAFLDAHGLPKSMDKWKKTENSK